MRLLLRSDTGEFSLTNDLVGDDTIPPYAILSHTWGANAEEVTFEDLTMALAKISLAMRRSGSVENKPDKMTRNTFGLTPVALTRQITPNSRRLLTLCLAGTATRLDATSICQMFQTLPSIPTRTLTRGRGNRISGKADGSSGGWTLQELLAPSSVEFFSRERQRLGDKRSLKQQIHEITSIADSALQGVPLSQFSVDERLSWIERRQTKLEEDKAYSLLGIFDVSMPLIYGEGRERAFKRLRKEIDSITADIAQ
jgi:hypothetical protein